MRDPLAGIVAYFAVALTLGVLLFMPFWDRRNQNLRDKVSTPTSSAIQTTVGIRGPIWAPPCSSEKKLRGGVVQGVGGSIPVAAYPTASEFGVLATGST